MSTAKKLSLDEVYLEHFGVKGMKWGVRKDSDGDVARFQTSGPVIDSTLHPATKTAGKEVAALMNDRYGFKITDIKSFPPDSEERARGTAAYVEYTPGRKGGVVYAADRDLRVDMKRSEDVGWSGKGTGNVRGLITHESAHALFHAEEQTKVGFLRAKVVGGNREARDDALKASVREAERTGIPQAHYISRVSGYAAASNTRHELEAELFTQYHWGTNPPSFVKVWGQTLHQEMGLDATPFKETMKHG